MKMDAIFLLIGVALYGHRVPVALLPEPVQRGDIHYAHPAGLPASGAKAHEGGWDRRIVFPVPYRDGPPGGAR